MPVGGGVAGEDPAEPAAEDPGSEAVPGDDAGAVGSGIRLRGGATANILRASESAVSCARKS